jgi:hypothetical protein
MLATIIVLAQSTEVVPEVNLSSSAWALEMGGLVFLLGAIVTIILGILQGGDEHSGGGRTIGYGVAMAAAAGISLYLSIQLGGRPQQTAMEQAWLYPLTTIIGTTLYASHTFNRATKRASAHRNQRGRSQAIAELHRTAASREITGAATVSTSKRYERPSRSSRGSATRKPSSRG